MPDILQSLFGRRDDLIILLAVFCGVPLIVYLTIHLSGRAVYERYRKQLQAYATDIGNIVASARSDFNLEQGGLGQLAVEKNLQVAAEITELERRLRVAVGEMEALQQRLAAPPPVPAVEHRVVSTPDGIGGVKFSSSDSKQRILASEMIRQFIRSAGEYENEPPHTLDDFQFENESFDGNEPKGRPAQSPPGPDPDPSDPVENFFGHG